MSARRSRFVLLSLSRLEARLRELESAAQPTASEIDPKLQQALEALGYL